MAKNGCLEFFGQFSQKNWYKFRMAKNGCFKFFPTIFPKKTDINLEWPFQIFSDNFPKKTGKIWNGQKWPF